MRVLSRVVILTIAVLTFTAVISAVGFWKYRHYRYGGMDLAIYTNVLWNLSRPTTPPLPPRQLEYSSTSWYSSIQGSSYLGDHVEPILLLIAPLFRLWSDPRLLLILQALALGLTAVPLFFLLRSSVRERWAMVLTTLWLFNPLLWNAALFEFHALAFAPLFLCNAAYCYVRRRFGWFLLWLLLSFSVREDVALIAVMFGAIALLDWWRKQRRNEVPSAPEHKLTRSVRWIVTPLILSIAWFLIATQIAAAHSPNGAYKFLVYYGWLRDAIGHPLTLLRHFLSIGNLDMVLGLLLPFLLLPLLRPRWLLLTLPPFLQILLAEPGGSNVVIELHYGLLFLPALALASIEAIAAWRLRGEHSNASNSGFECLECSPRYSEHSDRIRSIRMFLQRRFPLPKPFAIALGVATYLAAAWILGPFPGIANAAIRGASSDERARAAAYDELLQIVQSVQSLASDNSGASIAAGYAALPHIAAQAKAYALPYAYLGVNQYAFAPYKLPEDLQYLLLDQRDALAYAVQFPSVRWSAPHAADGPARLRQFIADGRFGIIVERDGVVLLERNVFPKQAKRVSARGGCAFGAEESPCMIDQRYFSPDHPVRGRLIIDSLRDIVLQADDE